LFTAPSKANTKNTDVKTFDAKIKDFGRLLLSQKWIASFVSRISKII
jgi:hypothetical protein